MTETEADTRANRIDPILRDAGWGVVEGAKVHCELIGPGRSTGGGGRANPLSADYVLSYREENVPDPFSTFSMPPEYASGLGDQSTTT